MIIYCSFIEDFEPKTCFVGLVELKGGTSSCIFDSLMFFLTKLGLCLDNVVSLGSDGAASMVGRINGLATRLKKRSPYMLSMHCITHKTNLCLVDAIKKSPYAQHIDDVVNDIARIFSNTPLQTAALTSLHEEFGCQRLKMSKIFRIRWLRRATSLHKVCESYEPLLVYVQQNNPHLYAKLKDTKMIYSFFSL